MDSSTCGTFGIKRERGFVMTVTVGAAGACSGTRVNVGFGLWLEAGFTGLVVNVRVLAVFFIARISEQGQLAYFFHVLGK